MKETPIVYNEYWTIECINRIKIQFEIASDLKSSLCDLERVVELQYCTDIRKLAERVNDLERSLFQTYSAMEQYRHDMESSINRIDRLIVIANQNSVKALE